MANGMKMWKGIGNATTLLFSLNRLMEYMMVLPEVKNTRNKMRIAIAKEAFNRKRSLLTCKLNIELKKKLVKFLKELREC